MHPPRALHGLLHFSHLPIPYKQLKDLRQPVQEPALSIQTRGKYVSPEDGLLKGQLDDGLTGVSAGRTASEAAAPPTPRGRRPASADRRAITPGLVCSICYQAGIQASVSVDDPVPC